jgi:hypothetical protein
MITKQLRLKTKLKTIKVTNENAGATQNKPTTRLKNYYQRPCENQKWVVFKNKICFYSGLSKNIDEGKSTASLDMDRFVV